MEAALPLTHPKDVAARLRPLHRRQSPNLLFVLRVRLTRSLRAPRTVRDIPRFLGRATREQAQQRGAESASLRVGATYHHHRRADAKGRGVV